MVDHGKPCGGLYSEDGDCDRVNERGDDLLAVWGAMIDSRNLRNSGAFGTCRRTFYSSSTSNLLDLQNGIDSVNTKVNALLLKTESWVSYSPYQGTHPEASDSTLKGSSDYSPGVT